MVFRPPLFKMFPGVQPQEWDVGVVFAARRVVDMFPGVQAQEWVVGVVFPPKRVVEGVPNVRTDPEKYDVLRFTEADGVL